MEGAMWDMHIRMAHAEWLAIRERYVRSQAYLRARGSLVGKAPRFYRIGPGHNAAGEPVKTLLPTAEGRKYVPAIFAKVIAGMALVAIAAWLDSEGVKPVAEGRNKSGIWSEWSLSRLIRNPVYSGTRKAADGTVELEVEALATIDTQRQAAEMLGRRVKPGRSTVRHEKALLAGLKCGNPKCDASGTPDTISPMYRIQPRGGQWYYRCKGTGAQRKGCGNMVPPNDLNDLIIVAFETWNDEPHTATEYVPGDSTADLVERLRLKASQAKTRQEANVLWDQIEQLEAQPSTEGHWETVTYDDYSRADHFLSLDPDGRRSELAKHDIRAWKESGRILATIDGALARKGRSALYAAPEGG
jgi:Recombinase